MRILGVDDSLGSLELAMKSKKAYYIRFGDGELLLLAQTIKMTKGNRQENSKELRSEINEAMNISDPFYLRAFSGAYPLEPGMCEGLFAPFGYRDDLDKIMFEYLRRQEPFFYNPVLFHYLGVFQPERLKRFIKENIRETKKMFVGCCSQKGMERLFGKIDYYVKTPSKNSYNYINDWWPDVRAHMYDVDTIILASGQSSAIVGKRLWKFEVEAHCIDFGSIVDPVDGVFDSRTCWKIKGKEVWEAFK